LSLAAGELDRHFQRSAYQQDDDLVFCHPQSGEPLDRSRLLKRFKAAAKRAGVREVRFHDLRRAFGQGAKRGAKLSESGGAPGEAKPLQQVESEVS
jgi:integrase